jgi:hypothetical protein
MIPTRLTFTRLSCATAMVVIAAAPDMRAQLAARDASPLARLEQSLDPETYRAVTKTIDGARARSLPTDPLVDRALEGAMKRAPGARIRAAVSALAERLEVARNELAPAPTDGDIAAGAGALGVGVPREALRAIRSIQPDRPVAVPLGVLTELVARRVPVDRAKTIVVDLLRRGASPPQLVALGEDVQRDIAAGIEPSAALDLRTRGVASALPGGGGPVNAETMDAPAAAQDHGLGGRNNPPRPPTGRTRRP